MQSAVLCPRKQSRLRQWCWKGLWACAGGLLPEKPSSTANSGTKGFRALPTRQTEPEHLPKTGLLQGKVNIAPPRILSLEWLYQKARNTTTALRMVAGKENSLGSLMTLLSPCASYGNSPPNFLLCELIKSSYCLIHYKSALLSLVVIPHWPNRSFFSIPFMRTVLVPVNI